MYAFKYEPEPETQCPGKRLRRISLMFIWGGAQAAYTAKTVLTVLTVLLQGLVLFLHVDDKPSCDRIKNKTGNGLNRSLLAIVGNVAGLV